MGVKKTPGLAYLGVVSDVQVVQQIFCCLRFDQLGAADVHHSRCAVRLLVDPVDDAMVDGHGFTFVCV